MNLNKLEKLCKQKNIELQVKPNGHYQLKGDLLVNYYPLSKNKSAYVAGTKKKILNVSMEAAVSMCFTAPPVTKDTDKRKGNTRKIRAALIKKGLTTCHWCKEELDINSSTLEHIIPLARGGLDNANNRTLACGDCNNDRGHNMPELNN